MKSNHNYLRPRDVAKEFGVNPKTVTRWEKEGIIHAAHRTPKGHRRYTMDEVERVKAVRSEPAH